MIRKVLGNNRGVALVVTIAVVILLITVTMELNRKVRTGVISASAARDRMTLSYMASSGIHIGMAMLMADKKKDLKENKEIDTVLEDWNDEEQIEEVLAEFPFEEGELSVSIADELGKIQVNALVVYPKGRELNPAQQQLWDRFLRPIVSLDEEADLNATTDIINSMKDWLDLGDDDAITGLNGAESDYYEGLDPPYSCRNGPFTHLGEMFMVKGVKPEYFENIGDVSLEELGGGALNGMLGDEALQALGGELPEDALDDTDGLSLADLGLATGISDFMTVYGMTHVEEANRKVDGRSFTFNGKININTADMSVLAALLPPGSELLAGSIYQKREFDAESTGVDAGMLATWGHYFPGLDTTILEAPNLADPTWYKTAPGCQDIKIDPNLISLKSDFFRITSTVFLNEMEMTVSAVVQREPIDKNDKNNKLQKNTSKWRCKVLSWETK